MAFVENVRGMSWFLNSTVGPVGTIIALRAQNVLERAHQNATGLIINQRTGDLVNGLRILPERRPQGPAWLVGSTAIHRDARYPAFVAAGKTPQNASDEEKGRWLKKALADEFANG